MLFKYLIFLLGVELLDLLRGSAESCLRGGGSRLRGWFSCAIEADRAICGLFSEIPNLERGGTAIDADLRVSMEVQVLRELTVVFVWADLVDFLDLSSHVSS